MMHHKMEGYFSKCSNEIYFEIFLKILLQIEIIAY